MKTHYNCKGHISIKTKENKYDIVKVQKRVYGDSTEASDDFHNLLNQILFEVHFDSFKYIQILFLSYLVKFLLKD